MALLSRYNRGRRHFSESHAHERCHADPSQIEDGDGKAAEELLPLVYDELRKLAAEKMAQEKPGQTLQATALVHEAYMRLVDVDKAQHWDSRGHFFAAAAEAMRRILVDQARRKKANEGAASGSVSNWTTTPYRFPSKTQKPTESWRSTKPGRVRGRIAPQGANWSSCDSLRG